MDATTRNTQSCCVLSFCADDNQEQTEALKYIRVTASALAALAIFAGVLALATEMSLFFAAAMIVTGVLMGGACLISYAKDHFKEISSREEQQIVTTDESSTEVTIPNTFVDNSTEIKPIDTQSNANKDVTQPEEKPGVKPDPVTLPVGKEIETKASAIVFNVNEILPRILSYMTATDAKKDIVQKCEIDSYTFDMFHNQYDLNRLPYDDAKGTVCVDGLKFGIPIEPLDLINFAFYSVLNGRYKGCKLEPGVVFLKTKITPSDTGFYTKDLLFQIDETISKFPQLESFPQKSWDIKYCYQDILRSHFLRLSRISFGNAKESDSKYSIYSTVDDLGIENLKFLVDSKVIKSWEVEESTQCVTFILSDLYTRF